MRIGIILFFYKNIKKQQYAHTKSVARLDDSENLSKKKTQHAHTNSVARFVNSENWSKTFFFYKNIKKQQYAHTKSVAARSVDSENLSKKNIFKKKKQYAYTKSVASRLVNRENLSTKNKK